MSDKTSIEWTDASWPIVNGCRRVSEGCRNCYAERLTATRLTNQPKYQGLATTTDSGPRWTGETRLWEPHLTLPLRWKRPRKIFVADMGDLFYEGVPDSDIDRVFAVMALAPRHTFQILTKRPERMRAYMTGANPEGVAARIAEAAQKLLGFDGERYAPVKPPALPSEEIFWIGACNPPDRPYRERWIIKPWPLPNVWLGTSVEDQATADARIPLLLHTPAAVHFVSYEPALAEVKFPLFPFCPTCNCFLIGKFPDEPDPRTHCRHCGSAATRISWLICGGESGPGARHFELAWARSAIAQCKAARVPVFVKQLGARPIQTGPVCGIECRCGLHYGFRDRKGGDMEEWPDDLKVRQFPAAVSR